MKIENAPRPLVGVGVLAFRNGKVLLGLRKNSHGAGTWSPPGGHLEMGETPEECAQREMLEETGISVSRLQRGPFTNDIFPEKNKHYVTLFLIAPDVTAEAVLKEPDKCSAWEWFPWENLPSPLFLPLQHLLAEGLPHRPC